ncbi:hypothetical protein Nepgr_022137 [Nepenthes gracilis]|uniref:Uncharacterized protein n=1 Tax=Nepenthes gracilis TaxID=150966 RepID=A0AAD3XY35_NEPGR|nr:hypothetical protein Nepgr_022137 [Nepenthes gracilis]
MSISETVEHWKVERSPETDELRKPKSPTCYDTGNFTSNGTYDQNRREVLSSILAGVADGESFVQATTGVEPDQVYSFAMCRGDVSSNACYTCVNESIYEITNGCPVQREAINWGLELHCMVRCFDHPLPESYETNPYVFLYNVNNVSINLDQFDQVFSNLTSTIITRASSGSTVKFAAGDLDLDHFHNLYALVQCIPILSVANCKACLQTAVGNFERQLPGKQGGVFLTPSCIFLYESYLFYNITEVDWVSSPPPPFVSIAPSSPAIKIHAGGGGRNSRPPIIMIVIPVVIISILAALTCLFVRNRSLAYIVCKKPDEDEAVQSLHFDFTTIKVAMNDFCEFNKLGEGGFGAVYKGTLSDGQDVAVKRLASGSSQGELEFKNEVLLMARLEYKNLVRLIGFCLEGIERILIYEFMPNASLDHFLFGMLLSPHELVFL